MILRERSTTKEKDIWDKMSAASALVASLLVPVVLAIVGNWYTSAIKQSEVRLKYTELAMTILKDKPSPDTEAVRRWAIEVIDQYSGVPMSAQAQKELVAGNLSTILFDNLDFSRSTFKRTNFDQSAFTGSSFKGVVFESSDCRNSKFADADFRGADLSTARTDDTTKLPK
jgi:hypothetical protein